MTETISNPLPRAFLAALAAAASFGFGGVPALVRKAFSMGTFQVAQGMRKIRGEVRINGTPAQEGALVRPGDVVTTGPDSMAVFVLGKDAYLVRDNTRVELGSESADAAKAELADILRIMRGKMLSVFGRGKRRLDMPTAVVGIRGSGISVEAEPARTYICTGYGIADIEARAAPGVRETVKTTHHESPLDMSRPLERTG